jgi:hypothetical protein
MLYLTSLSLFSSRARSSCVPRRLVYFEVAATQQRGDHKTAVAGHLRALQGLNTFFKFRCARACQEI